MIKINKFAVLLVLALLSSTTLNAQFTTTAGMTNIPFPIADSNITVSGQTFVARSGQGFFLGYGGAYVTGLRDATLALPSAYSIQAAHPMTSPYIDEGVYVLKFSIKNFFYSYPGEFDVLVTMGPQICDMTGCKPTPCPNGPLGTGPTCTPDNPGSQYICSRDGWAMPSWTEVTMVCPNPAYLAWDQSLSLPGVPPAKQTSQLPLTVSFYTAGWTTYYENISFTFTPIARQGCDPYPGIGGACNP